MFSAILYLSFAKMQLIFEKNDSFIVKNKKKCGKVSGKIINILILLHIL